MPKTFLLKYIRNRQVKDMDICAVKSERSEDEDEESGSHDDERYSMPPTPPSPRSTSRRMSTTSARSESSSVSLGTNPLSQFAEISLTMANSHQNYLQHQKDFYLQQAHLASMMWPSMAAAALAAASFAGSKEVSSPSLNSWTPSNSPSPPPAHISPVNMTQGFKPRMVVTSPPPPPAHPASLLNAARFALLDPPQNVPEDLRVVARKLDFPSPSPPPLRRGVPAPVSSSPEPIVIVDDTVDTPSNSLKKSKGDMNHECPECGKVYSTSSNLARHRQTHRSLEDKKAKKCPHCDKMYVSMPAFSMHLRTHNQGCKCPYCGKCFSRPWLLQGHIRTHTGEKPFRCNVCDKAFADKSNLRAHIQTHSNAKPFVCHRCHKAFALKSYLYKHEESSCMRVNTAGESSPPPDQGPKATAKASLTFDYLSHAVSQASSLD